MPSSPLENRNENYWVLKFSELNWLPFLINKEYIFIVETYDQHARKYNRHFENN